MTNYCRFQLDHTDAYERQWCVCRRLKNHAAHRPLPPLPTDAAELEARILGEHDREDGE